MLHAGMLHTGGIIYTFYEKMNERVSKTQVRRQSNSFKDKTRSLLMRS
jgi:uncharacterized membrane protein